MKKRIILFAILPAILFAQNVKVTDYDVPISKAQTLRFDGNWNWAQTGHTVNANNANGNLLYRTFYSSLPLAWFVDVDATGSKNFSDYSYNVVLDASFRKYIWENRDYFGFARFVTQGTDVYDHVRTDLTIGFGYGRYINATALAKAVRIEDHLLKDEVLAGSLPKETMLAIAHIIEREEEYRDLYGEVYEQHLFDDIEKEIEDSGMLKEQGIGSIGVLRMRQVLFNINERVNDRYYGWDITAGVLFPVVNAYEAIPGGSPNLTIGGRYSFPINWRLQINTTAEVFTPLDSAAFDEVRARIGLDFIYELSNRINFVTNYRFGMFKPASGKVTNDNNLAASFWYYIENNIYLTLSGSYIQLGTDPGIITTTVGLQYNLF